MAQISYAKAAEQLANKKALLEKKASKGDKWTQNALAPQLAKIDAKMQELQQMNEQARQEKFDKGFNRFMKKYGGMVGNEVIPSMHPEAMMANGGYLPQFWTGSPVPYSSDYADGPIDYSQGAYDSRTQGIQGEGYSTPDSYQGVQIYNSLVNPVSIQRMAPQVPIEKVQPRGLNNMSQEVLAQKNIEGDIPPTTRNKYNYLDPKQGKGLTISTPSDRALETGAQMLPMAYNAFMAMKPIEKSPYYTNPYEAEAARNIRSAMNTNIAPQLENIRRTGANERLTSRTAAMGSGADYMRYASGANRRQQMSENEILAWKQQMDNQAKLQGSQLLYGFGQGQIQNKMYKQDWDAQATAAKRNYAKQLTMDTSEYAQRNQLMRNMKGNDQMMLNYWNQMGYYNR